MFIPSLLLFLATLLGAVMAYGTHPNWAGYPHGLDFILMARQWQWPLAFGSVLGCVAVLGMVISGKKSAWWLIGLAPVLALFYHRFVVIQHSAMSLVENPSTVSAELATFLRDDDMVLGVEFKDTPFALPFAALYAQPVVLLSDRDQRVIVLWSAFANRALAFSIERGMKARELEVVSVPANGLLLYNNKYGQFIFGMTGRTSAGTVPTGFSNPVPTTKMSWKQWQNLHPASVVMVPVGSLDQLPTRAISPFFKMPASTQPTNDEPKRVSLVGTDAALAIDPVGLGGKVLNTSVGSTPILILTDPVTQRLRVYERRAKDDLFPTFKPHRDKSNPAVALVDSDSNSHWTTGGVCVNGALKGERLKPVPVDEDIPLDVLQFWYPKIQLLDGRSAR